MHKNYGSLSHQDVRTHEKVSEACSTVPNNHYVELTNFKHL